MSPPSLFFCGSVTLTCSDSFVARDVAVLQRDVSRSFVAVIQEWLLKKIPLWFCVQTPGSAVYSPSTPRGAAHVVLTVGPSVVQTAWNSGVCLDAFRACLGKRSLNSINRST
jgi:hypothetical protein